MKTKSELFYPLFLALIPILMVLALYSKIPQIVAIHFNFNFEPDGYAPKWTLFLFSGLFLLVEVFICYCINNEKFGAKENMRIYRIIAWIIPVLSVLLQFITISYALNKNLSIIRLAPLVVGTILIILGNSIPKITKPNKFCGIRLPWTMENKDNWIKTNRLFGRLTFLLGLVFILASFINLSAKFIICCILLVLIIPVFFSYQLSKDT